jgi:hypothetical protein
METVPETVLENDTDTESVPVESATAYQTSE